MNNTLPHISIGLDEYGAVEFKLLNAVMPFAMQISQQHPVHLLAGR